MRFLLEFYPGDKIIFFAFNVLLQTAIIILIAWLLAKIIFQRNAAIRYYIWLSVLIFVIISPAITYIANAADFCIFKISLPQSTSLELKTINSEAPQLMPIEHAESRQIETEKQTSSASIKNYPRTAGDSKSSFVPQFFPKSQSFSFIDRLRVIGVLIIAIWAAGIIYFFMRMIQRGFALHRLCANIQPIDENSNLSNFFAEIRRLLNIDHLPGIFLWRDRQIRLTPLTIGIIRPSIILSQDLLGSLNRNEFRDVLIHECAHVLRRDPLIGLIQRIVYIMFWPYPLVWFMNRNLSRAREEVCDNYVLMHTEAPHYAQTLLSLSQRIYPISPSLAHLGLFQCHWPLEQRVAGLLDTRRNVMTKINVFAMSVFSVMFLAVVFIVTGTRLLQAQSPTQAAKTEDSQLTVQRRTINKFVKDFPEKVDLSTPESACAAWHRAWANMDAKAVYDLGWEKTDPREIQNTERFIKHDAGNEPEQYKQDELNTKVVEVAIYHDDYADVICKLKLPERNGHNPYSARGFGRINGVWKNMGENCFPSLELARKTFDENKDVHWKSFQETKDIVTGKTKPVTDKGEIISPDKYDQAKAETPDAEKLLLMGLVENFFLHNGRDITARKSLEWGDVEKNEDGTRSIRYKFEARIWDRDTMIADQRFTFDKDNVIIQFEHIRQPQKKEQNAVDTNTKDGVISLVEDFFKHNFRDVTWRKTIEWGDIEKDKDENVSIRYKYEARIWDKETKIMNQIFTFDKKGEFIKYEDVKGSSQDSDASESKNDSNTAVPEKVYEVHKKVSEFPEKEDLSTPENAYASIERAWVNEGSACWPRLSVPELAKQMQPGKKEPIAKKDAERFLNAEILEVHIWKNSHAVVVAKMTGIQNKFWMDLRWLINIDGHWLNDGNDGADTIESARNKIKKFQNRP